MYLGSGTDGEARDRMACQVTGARSRVAEILGTRPLHGETMISRALTKLSSHRTTHTAASLPPLSLTSSAYFNIACIRLSISSSFLFSPDFLIPP